MESLIDYRGLKQLLLDNNKLECQGAKTLALALPHMELEDLNLGFNGIKWDGMLGIINSSSASRTLRSLTLSGNAIDDNVSVALANMLAVNTVLSALYLDHTGLSPHAEKMIANGIARNKHLALQVLTGMDLGKALVQLGSPIECAAMSNDQSLRYLVQVWAHHEHQQHVDSQQFSRCVEDKPQSPAAESSAQAASIASSQSNATMSSCNGSGSQTPVDSLISSDQSRKDVIDNLRSVVVSALVWRGDECLIVCT